MTPLRISLGFVIGSCVAVMASCTTFDPNLGSQPFRCGTDNPRCPDGYVCKTYSPTDEICELEGADPSDRADSGPNDTDARALACNNDSEIEPNESLNDPTLTGIPDVQLDTRLVGLAICPSTDQDFFRFDIAVNATDATVEIEYQADRGLLKLDLLNSTGTSISAAIPSGGNENILRAAVPNLPLGTYYAHVRSEGAGVQNNYLIEIITTP